MNEFISLFLARITQREIKSYIYLVKFRIKIEIFIINICISLLNILFKYNFF